MIVKLLNGDLFELDTDRTYYQLGALTRMLRQHVPRHTTVHLTSPDGTVTYTDTREWVDTAMPGMYLFLYLPTEPQARTHYVMVPRDTRLTDTDLPDLAWGDLAVAIDVYACMSESIGGRNGEYVFDGAEWIRVEKTLPEMFRILENHPDGFTIPPGYWPNLVVTFRPTARQRVQIVESFVPSELSAQFHHGEELYHIQFDFRPFHLSLDEESAHIVAPHLICYLSAASEYRVRGAGRTLFLDVFALS
jgi:hypothetical protein